MAYSHLQAGDERAYESRAAYALYGVALEELAKQCSYADLGAAAGTADAADDGLARFKRGWATESRAAHLCKSVLDRAAYSELTAASGAGESAYFPAYRAGELS